MSDPRPNRPLQASTASELLELICEQADRITALAAKVEALEASRPRPGRPRNPLNDLVLAYMRGNAGWVTPITVELNLGLDPEDSRKVASCMHAMGNRGELEYRLIGEGRNRAYRFPPVEKKDPS